jgi:hypothetical protein
MPLPMIHLAIAIKLAESEPSAAEPDFLLGSLAPDAIHMRSGAGMGDKNATHLRDAQGKPDLAGIRTFLNDNRYKAELPASFAAGYAAHLISDYLWIATIYTDFKRQLTHLDPEALRKLYYLETDQVDFDLYRQMDWREKVWDQLSQAIALDFPPLLSADEIDGWRDHTLHWFDELKQEPRIVPQYITDDLTFDFIEQACREVSAFLYHHPFDSHSL